MKIRGYKLRFIRYESDLYKGMLVSLNGQLPIGEYPMEPHRGGTPNLGTIHNVIEDKRLGTIYEVKEDETGRIHKYIEEKLCPISAVFVSDDKVEIGKLFYHDGVMDICDEVIEGNERGVVRCLVGRQTKKVYIASMCDKVVARSHEIALVVNDGPPHDHNQTWKFEDGKYLYLEDLHSKEISRLVYYGSKVRVLVDDENKPIFFEGKVIIDGYNMYSGK
jgi:hypothetical protein